METVNPSEVEIEKLKLTYDENNCDEKNYDKKEWMRELANIDEMNKRTGDEVNGEVSPSGGDDEEDEIAIEKAKIKQSMLQEEQNLDNEKDKVDNETTEKESDAIGADENDKRNANEKSVTLTDDQINGNEDDPETAEPTDDEKNTDNNEQKSAENKVKKREKEKRFSFGKFRHSFGIGEKHANKKETVEEPEKTHDVNDTGTETTETVEPKKSKGKRKLHFGFGKRSKKTEQEAPSENHHNKETEEKDKGKRKKGPFSIGKTKKSRKKGVDDAVKVNVEQTSECKDNAKEDEHMEVDNVEQKETTAQEAEKKLDDENEDVLMKVDGEQQNETTTQEAEAKLEDAPMTIEVSEKVECSMQSDIQIPAEIETELDKEIENEELKLNLDDNDATFDAEALVAEIMKPAAEEETQDVSAEASVEVDHEAECEDISKSTEHKIDDPNQAINKMGEKMGETDVELSDATLVASMPEKIDDDNPITIDETQDKEIAVESGEKQISDDKNATEEKDQGEVNTVVEEKSVDLHGGAKSKKDKHFHFPKLHFHKKEEETPKPETKPNKRKRGKKKKGKKKQEDNRKEDTKEKSPESELEKTAADGKEEPLTGVKIEGDIPAINIELTSDDPKNKDENIEKTADTQTETKEPNEETIVINEPLESDDLVQTCLAELAMKDQQDDSNMEEPSAAVKSGETECSGEPLPSAGDNIEMEADVKADSFEVEKEEEADTLELETPTLATDMAIGIDTILPEPEQEATIETGIEGEIAVEMNNETIADSEPKQEEADKSTTEETVEAALSEEKPTEEDQPPLHLPTVTDTVKIKTKKDKKKRKNPFSFFFKKKKKKMHAESQPTDEKENVVTKDEPDKDNADMKQSNDENLEGQTADADELASKDAIEESKTETPTEDKVDNVIAIELKDEKNGIGSSRNDDTDNVITQEEVPLVKVKDDELENADGEEDVAIRLESKLECEVSPADVTDDALEKTDDQEDVVIKMESTLAFDVDEVPEKEQTIEEDVKDEFQTDEIIMEGAIATEANAETHDVEKEMTFTEDDPNSIKAQSKNVNDEVVLEGAVANETEPITEQAVTELSTIEEKPEPEVPKDVENQTNVEVVVKSKKKQKKRKNPFSFLFGKKKKKKEINLETTEPISTENYEREITVKKPQVPGSELGVPVRTEDDQADSPDCDQLPLDSTEFAVEAEEDQADTPQPDQVSQTVDDKEEPETEAQVEMAEAQDKIVDAEIEQENMETVEVVMESAVAIDESEINTQPTENEDEVPDNLAVEEENKDEIDKSNIEITMEGAIADEIPLKENTDVVEELETGNEDIQEGDKPINVDIQEELPITDNQDLKEDETTEINADQPEASDVKVEVVADIEIAPKEVEIKPNAEQESVKDKKKKTKRKNPFSFLFGKKKKKAKSKPDEKSEDKEVQDEVKPAENENKEEPIEIKVEETEVKEEPVEAKAVETEDVDSDKTEEIDENKVKAELDVNIFEKGVDAEVDSQVPEPVTDVDVDLPMPEIKIDLSDDVEQENDDNLEIVRESTIAIDENEMKVPAGESSDIENESKVQEHEISDEKEPEKDVHVEIIMEGTIAVESPFKESSEDDKPVEIKQEIEIEDVEEKQQENDSSQIPEENVNESNIEVAVEPEIETVPVKSQDETFGETETDAKEPDTAKIDVEGETSKPKEKQDKKKKISFGFGKKKSKAKEPKKEKPDDKESNKKDDKKKKRKFKFSLFKKRDKDKNKEAEKVENKDEQPDVKEEAKEVVEKEETDVEFAERIANEIVNEALEQVKHHDVEIENKTVDDDFHETNHEESTLESLPKEEELTVEQSDVVEKGNNEVDFEEPVTVVTESTVEAEIPHEEKIDEEITMNDDEVKAVDEPDVREQSDAPKEFVEIQTDVAIEADVTRELPDDSKEVVEEILQVEESGKIEALPNEKDEDEKNFNAEIDQEEQATDEKVEPKDDEDERTKATEVLIESLNLPVPDLEEEKKETTDDKGPEKRKEKDATKSKKQDEKSKKQAQKKEAREKREAEKKEARERKEREKNEAKLRKEKEKSDRRQRKKEEKEKKLKDKKKKKDKKKATEADKQEPSPQNEATKAENSDFSFQSGPIDTSTPKSHYDDDHPPPVPTSEPPPLTPVVTIKPPEPEVPKTDIEELPYITPLIDSASEATSSPEETPVKKMEEKPCLSPIEEAAAPVPGTSKTPDIEVEPVILTVPKHDENSNKTGTIRLYFKDQPVSEKDRDAPDAVILPVNSETYSDVYIWNPQYEESQWLSEKGLRKWMDRQKRRIYGVSIKIKHRPDGSGLFVKFRFQDGLLGRYNSYYGDVMVQKDKTVSKGLYCVIYTEDDEIYTLTLRSPPSHQENFMDGYLIRHHITSGASARWDAALQRPQQKCKVYKV